MSSRVLQVVLSLAPGGTERLAIELSKRLHARHGMAVCCLDEIGAWASELMDLGIPVTALARGEGFRPDVGRRIAAIAREQDADVLHCHHYSPFVYGAVARAWRPLRLVFTEHGRSHDGPPSWKRRLANQIVGRVDASVHAVSQDLKRHMVAEGFAADRIHVVYNGVDVGPLPTPRQRESARAALGLALDQPVIGAVGRLDSVKDLPTLVAAFQIVLSSHPSAKLVLIGDGPERSRLEKAIMAEGLRDCVALAGYRADARALLAALDVYVNCSIFEGVSLTILEAMAAGVPVIATRVGGTPEVVQDGVTGRLVPARQPVVLAETLKAVLTDTARAHSIATCGRAQVEERFSLARMVRTYAAIYEGRVSQPCVA